MNKPPKEGEKVKWEGSENVETGVVEVPEPICREEFYEPEALIDLGDGNKVWINHERLISDE